VNPEPIPNPILIQSALWPGVAGVLSVTGTISVGITPALFVLRTVPQAGLPAIFGDLAFSDGYHSVVFRGCKASLMTGETSGEGRRGS